VTAGVEGITTAQPAAARRRHGPWFLWVLALAVLAPVVVPFAVLLWRVLDASESARDVLFSTNTLRLIVNTLTLTAAVTATAAAVGVAAAWLVTRTRIPGRSVWTVLVTLPLVIPSYVMALAYVSAFGTRGLFNDLFGVELPRVSGFWGAWLVLSLSTYPFVFLVTAAALRRLDRVHEEAARGLGATPARVFRTVILPQLRPAIGAGALLVALYTLSDFGAVSLMRFDSFTRVIYAQYQGRLDRTPAAVLALILVILALGVLWLEQRTRGRAAFFTHRPSRPPRTFDLRRRQAGAAVGFLGVVTTLGLFLPIAVLTAWLLRGSASGQSVEIEWGAVAGSLSSSTAAAVLAAAMAIPIAVLVVRFPSWRSVWLERSVYATFSLPHITVALAVVFFAANYLGLLYQSFALLVIIYAVIFLAQALGSARSSLLQVDPQLEEASRGLGRGSVQTLARITIPLIWKGLLVGAGLVFLTAMKELPATLLLRPTGFDTLAVSIWSAADELLYAEAAAPALLLVAVSALPMYWLSRRTDDR
jgi:iron(III) transport system permease protein